MQNDTTVLPLTTPQITMINNFVTCVQVIMCLICAMVGRARIKRYTTRVMLNSLSPSDFLGLRKDLLDLILNQRRDLVPKQETTVSKRTRRHSNMENGNRTGKDSATT
ncbi:MAG: replication-associated protein [Circoviridae sp.]|nr:MAG: replication-associated protein [Circoviridae sp.]